MSALAILAVPATAGAAQRYVTTTGSGSACTQPSPCSIETGINSASSSDEVIIAPGTYTTSTTLANSNTDVTVRGADAADPPLIKSSAPTAVQFNGFSAAASDLRIDHTGNSIGAFLFSSSASFKRIVVHSSSPYGACDSGPAVVMSDVVCTIDTDSAFALRDSFTGPSDTSHFRNVTAVATGNGGIGFVSGAGSGTTNVVDAANVIFKGDTTDVSVATASPGATVAVTFANSNYSSVDTTGNVIVTPAGAGTNQTKAPKFASTKDFTEDPRSPTVDAGIADAYTGSSDFQGDPRPLGSAMDIGADELVPDTTAPETTIAKGPKKKTTSKKAKFKLESDEAGVKFACTLDKAKAKTCRSPLKLKRLKPGRHKLSVVAIDPSGNRDATPATYKWKVKRKR